MFTYFIAREGEPYIKIGKTQDLRSRVRGHQCSSVFEFFCFAYLEGDREEELHERFHHCRVKGEWFRPEPDLCAFIIENAIPADIRCPAYTPEAALKRRIQKRELMEWRAKEEAKRLARSTRKGRVA